jgi:hypothetical protein
VRVTPFPIPECVAALSVNGVCIMADDSQTPPVEPIDPDADDARQQDDDSGGGGGGNPPQPGKPR